MDNTRPTLSEKIKFWLTILLFGSLWGIVEATLGTMLHLPMFHHVGMYAASTTIIVPIAYFLMANCYKKTNSLLSVFFMGILAALIKMTVGFVVGFRPSVYNPAIYIVIESLAMMGALAVFRPKNVLSFRSLATVILANTTFMLSYLMINMAMGGANIFTAKGWTNVGEVYLFGHNCLAILYMFAAGGLFYGVLKLLEHFNVEVKFDYKRILYSPITASVAFTVAVALTITFAAIV